jgi:hypothetical protein
MKIKENYEMTKTAEGEIISKRVLTATSNNKAEKKSPGFLYNSRNDLYEKIKNIQ